jgi:hypothetical protein
MSSDLISILIALVMSDGAPSGLDGAIAIGIRSPEGDRWCRLELAGLARAEPYDSEPSDVEASLVMGRSEAESILERGRLPEVPTLLAARGDRELIKRFIARYLGKNTPATIRASREPAKPRSRRKPRKPV